MCMSCSYNYCITSGSAASPKLFRVVRFDPPGRLRSTLDTFLRGKRHISKRRKGFETRSISGHWEGEMGQFVSIFQEELVCAEQINTNAIKSH